MLGTPLGSPVSRRSMRGDSSPRGALPIVRGVSHELRVPPQMTGRLVLSYMANTGAIDIRAAFKIVFEYRRRVAQLGLGTLLRRLATPICR